MTGGVVPVFIHAQHEGDVFVAGRRGYDDLLCADLKMRRGSSRVSENTCAFDDDLHAHIGPRELRRIAVRKGADIFTIYDNAVSGCFDCAGIDAVCGIVLEEVRVGLGVGTVVHRDDFQLTGVALTDGTKHLPADTPEPVDAHASSHYARTLPSRLNIGLRCLSSIISIAKRYNN